MAGDVPRPRRKVQAGVGGAQEGPGQGPGSDGRPPRTTGTSRLHYKWESTSSSSVRGDPTEAKLFSFENRDRCNRPCKGRRGLQRGPEVTDYM